MIVFPPSSFSLPETPPIGKLGLQRPDFFAMIPPPQSFQVRSSRNSIRLKAMYAPRLVGRTFASARTVAAMVAMSLFAAASFGQGPGYPPSGNYGPPSPNPYANVYVPPPASPVSAPSPQTYIVPAPSPQTYVVPAATDSQPSGWIAGAGVYYFQPRWGTNPAYATSILSSDGGQETQQDFSSKGAFAPLLWLGYVADNGLGVRGRWWQFSARSSVSADNPSQTDPDITTTIYSAYPMGVGFAAANSPGVDNPLQFDSELAMNVVDLEIIRDLRIGRGSIVLGAGMRYAYINQKYNATWLYNDLSDSTQNETTTLTSGHNFSGVGPILSMEVRCPVGQEGLALLASTRGALLFGTGNQQANASSVDAFGNLLSTYSNSQSSGGTLPVLEFEIGASGAAAGTISVRHANSHGRPGVVQRRQRRQLPKHPQLQPHGQQRRVPGHARDGRRAVHHGIDLLRRRGRQPVRAAARLTLVRSRWSLIFVKKFRAFDIRSTGSNMKTRFSKSKRPVPCSRFRGCALERLEPRELLSAAAIMDVAAHPLAVWSKAARPSAVTAEAPFTPAQISHAYGLDRLPAFSGGAAANGAGQTIAIVDSYDDPTLAADVSVFDAQFNLSQLNVKGGPTLTKVNQNGGSSLPGVDSTGGWEVEESLDVEWAHAMASGANILLVEAASDNLSDLLAATNYARNQAGVSVVSLSWGTTEFPQETQLDGYFTTPAGHQGVSFVAAAGDWVCRRRGRRPRRTWWPSAARRCERSTQRGRIAAKQAGPMAAAA